jgi:hypothetical protein
MQFIRYTQVVRFEILVYTIVPQLRRAGLATSLTVTAQAGLTVDPVYWHKYFQLRPDRSIPDRPRQKISKTWAKKEGAAYRGAITCGTWQRKLGGRNMRCSRRVRFDVARTTATCRAHDRFGTRDWRAIAAPGPGNILHGG